MRIKEVIVVEGKDDISAVKRAVDAEVIATGGMGITEETLRKIEEAGKRSGVVILTDPDYPGEKIRQIVNQRVGSCKHAYLTQKQARCKFTGKIGVEYAEPEIIREALLAAKVQQHSQEDLYTMEDLLQWGLTGSAKGGQRRARLGEILGIGKTNAKQFLRRLNSFGVPRQEIEEGLAQMEGLEWL
ncbi:MAG: ribonuclease M5 [Clostridia bacterium]|nr:ribonuclease M5 [Clostridia bacterium]